MATPNFEGEGKRLPESSENLKEEAAGDKGSQRIPEECNAGQRPLPQQRRGKTGMNSPSMPHPNVDLLASLIGTG